MCARKQDLLSSECQVMEPGAVQRLQELGIGSAELPVVLPILLWLVASLFVDSKRALFLVGYGTLWMPFWVP
jgi:hypothetical protein